MSRVRGQAKEALDSRLRSALELMKRNENREAFSILSKELYNIATIELKKDEITCDSSSFLYKYELVFKLICSFEIDGSFDFLMHFIAVDIYINNLGHSEIESTLIDDINRYNVLLFGFINLLINTQLNRALSYNITGYEFISQLEMNIGGMSTLY